MIIKILFIFLIIFIINYFFKKFNYLNSRTGSSHQLFANISIPLSGGIFMSLPIIYFFLEHYPIFIFFYFLLFFLGIFSDLSIIKSPKTRFLLQFIILAFFSISTKLEVLPSRIDLIDSYLMGTAISYLFTSFCLMVLINGSNFIDGLNGLMLGYFLIILFILFKSDLHFFINLEVENKILIFLIFCSVLILNFSNYLFSGDNGSYSLSFLVGYFLIKIYNLDNNISPYFIILLLWYPCFENLFSIIRKKLTKRDPLSPDNNHLHHYLFLILKSKLKISKLIANNLASILINLINFFILYVGSNNINNTILQFQLIVLASIFYVFIYFFLRRITLKILM